MPDVPGSDRGGEETLVSRDPTPREKSTEVEQILFGRFHGEGGSTGIRTGEV